MAFGSSFPSRRPETEREAEGWNSSGWGQRRGNGNMFCGGGGVYVRVSAIDDGIEALQSTILSRGKTCGWPRLSHVVAINVVFA